MNRTGATARREHARVRRVPAVLRGAGAVTAGSLVANVLAYLLHLPASRWLGPEGYGAFAALLSAQLIAAVPSLALQAVVARDRVLGSTDAGLRALGRRTAVLVAGLAALAVVPVSTLLDTPVTVTAAALAPGPLLCLLATEQGLVQGRERFGVLGLLLALAGLGKVVPVVAVLAAGGGVGPALAAGAVGVAVAWGVARVLGSPGRRDDGPESDAAAGTTVATVLAAGQVQLVMMALTSVDLVLARALLDPAEAGRYALGAVAAKAAFWLPQAVGTVLYPRMADPAGHRGAVRAALAVLGGIGAVVVLAAAVAGPLVPVFVGEAYRPVVGLLWAFAALGVLLSELQALLLSAIAAERTREALVAWAGLAATVLAVWPAPRTVPAVLAATTLVVAVTTALGAALSSRR